MAVALKSQLYPKDFDFNKIISGMNTVADQLRAYNKMDVEATMFVFRRLHKKLYRKPKTRAFLRTTSDRKRAGQKANKPKYGWSKKRKARGGWKV